MNETWLDNRSVYSGKIISVRIGDVRIADGALTFREVVEHPGGVAIVPVFGDSVILVSQFRIALGEEIIEIPAGKLEGAEDPETRARLELEEETGFRAGRLVPAGVIYSSVGYTSERIHLFLAFDLEKTVQRPESDERIRVEALPLRSIEERLAGHEFRDAKTIIGLQRLLAHGYV